MRAYRCLFLALCLIVVPARAADNPGPIIQDTWYAAFLDGVKAGHVRTTIREGLYRTEKSLRTTTELDFVLKRRSDLVRLRVETGSEETADGKVVGVSMRQFDGNRPTLVLQGTVIEDQLEVRVSGTALSVKRISWPPHVVGLHAQSRLFEDRKVKPGASFSYLSYEPTYNYVVTNRVTVRDYEEVSLLQGKRNLLRVETLPDKIVVPGTTVELPRLVTWLDEERKPLKSSFELPQLGTVVLYRTTAEQVKAPATSGKLLDIYEKSLIRITRVIPYPNQTRSAVYRITLEGDDDPTTAFVGDSRQQCKNASGSTFELHVRSIREPARVEKPEKPGEEFLRSCPWINSEDAKTQDYTRQAVGSATDPWTKAKLIQRWVRGNMQVSFTETFAPSDQVANSLRGDCRQYTLLLTAMSRAAGVPSRTALGLCYAMDKTHGPAMAFHMWTEVWVRGQWMALDATRPEGYVGATHLKITDHSWADVQSPTPLLPVSRILGRVRIEVVRFEEGQ